MIYNLQYNCIHNILYNILYNTMQYNILYTIIGLGLRQPFRAGGHVMAADLPEAVKWPVGQLEAEKLRPIRVAR